MARTHDMGNLYVQQMRYLHRKAAPLIWEKGWTDELEHPFRRGTCIVVRVPCTRVGLVFGHWGPPGNEEDRLNSAVGLREIGTLDDSLMAEEAFL